MLKRLIILNSDIFAKADMNLRNENFDKYSFTKAYKLFIDFARELTKTEMNDANTTNRNQ